MTDPRKIQSGWSVKWPAPAKLNLLLRIIGQREDGYHLLQTVFQFVDLCDWLKFHDLEDDRVTRMQAIPGVREDDDLTVRAARLLKAETGYAGGVCIEIEKNLPMGGGLGGGSSDAATTLVALNKLWNLGLPIERLQELGLTLGADVPVFVYGRAAWAEGVGEKLQEIIVPEQWLVIIKPDCHVDTGEIFNAGDLTRDSKPITINGFLSGEEGNDCLPIVCKRYPQVEEAMAALSGYGEARLTGTGACVFVQFNEKESAVDAFKALNSDWEVFLAKGMNISPLQQLYSLSD